MGAVLPWVEPSHRLPSLAPLGPGLGKWQIHYLSKQPGTCISTRAVALSEFSFAQRGRRRSLSQRTRAGVREKVSECHQLSESFHTSQPLSLTLTLSRWERGQQCTARELSNPSFLCSIN